MEVIELLDKKFELYISENDLLTAVKAIAKQINRDFSLQDNPLFICILNGSFMFAADLMKEISFPCEISFVKLASYKGTESTGKITELIGLKENIEGRKVILIEDIVDTGVTMQQLISQLDGYLLADLKIASLFYKPEACKIELPLNYVGIELPEKFIVGYGLDYNGLGRNLKNVYSVVD